VPLYCFGVGLAAWLSGYDVGLWLADFPWSMLDLWLTCDQFVGKVSAMGQPTGPTQPSVPPGSVNVITWITGGWKPLNGRPGLRMAIGCTPALSMIQKRRCSCGVRLVTLYKCYMPLPLTQKSAFQRTMIFHKKTGSMWWTFLVKSSLKVNSEGHKLFSKYNDVLTWQKMIYIKHACFAQYFVYVIHLHFCLKSYCFLLLVLFIT